MRMLTTLAFSIASLLYLSSPAAAHAQRVDQAADAPHTSMTCCSKMTKVESQTQDGVTNAVENDAPSTDAASETKKDLVEHVLLHGMKM